MTLQLITIWVQISTILSISFSHKFYINFILIVNISSGGWKVDSPAHIVKVDSHYLFVCQNQIYEITRKNWLTQISCICAKFKFMRSFSKFKFMRNQKELIRNNYKKGKLLQLMDFKSYVGLNLLWNLAGMTLLWLFLMKIYPN